MAPLRPRPTHLWCLVAPLFLAIALAGCFEPEIPEGLACAENGTCPAGQICGAAGLCVYGDNSETDDKVSLGPDAGVEADASQELDAAGPDAPPPDPLIQTLTFEYTGVVTSFVVPDGVTKLTIEAFGAAGGNGIGPEIGGKGARIRGEVTVVPGTALRILVGGRGQDAEVISALEYEQGGGSGGGGSFVVTASGTPLVIAGGGGGATYRPTRLDGGPGQITEAGQAGGSGGAGGEPGLGGTSSSNSGGFHVGTGGGGFATGGVGNSDGSTSNYGTVNLPGSSYIDGGAGGVGGSKGRDGGFGGGGSAGFTGGGGGGYAGGGSGHYSATDRGGGGGGSYNAGDNPVNEAGVRDGNGLVVISWLE